LLFLASILPVGPSAEALSGWIVLFVASGLVTLALHGVLDTLRQQAEKTGVLLRIDRYWAMTAFGIVVIVLAVGLLVGQMVAPNAIANALGWLRPLWTTLGRILLLLLLAVAYLFFGLFEPLLAGLQDRPRQNAPRVFQSPLDPENLERLARDPIQVPPILGRIVQAVLILGGVALIAWIFVRAVRRQKRKTIAEDEVLETRETILSLDLVQNQLQGLLDGLRRPKAPPVFVDAGSPGDPRRVVRELYQELLARGISLDVPRAKSQTPGTYQETLGHLYSGGRGDLERLTAIYEVARYGLEPPTQDQVRAAQEAFTRIDARLQSARRAQAQDVF
jgi:hypothetical protein